MTNCHVKYPGLLQLGGGGESGQLRALADKLRMFRFQRVLTKRDSFIILGFIICNYCMLVLLQSNGQFNKC